MVSFGKVRMLAVSILNKPAYTYSNELSIISGQNHWPKLMILIYLLILAKYDIVTVVGNNRHKAL